MDLTTVVTQIAILFIMMLAGYAFGRLRLFSPHFSKDLTNLLVDAGLPCMIFISMLQKPSAGLHSASLWIFLVGLGFLLLSGLVATLLTRLLPIPGGKRGIWSFAATYANNAFMGFPVVYALFGEEGLLLAAIFNAAVGIHLYTLGVLTLAARPGAKIRMPLRQTLFSNINIALLLGLFFFLTQIPLPAFIYTGVDSFGRITTPLSMVIVGLHMSQGSLLRAFKDKSALGVTAMRLIFMPLLLIFLARFLVTTETILAYQVLAVSVAMPVAVIVVVLTERFEGMVDFATNTVVVSTSLSLITIPLLMLLLQSVAPG